MLLITGQEGEGKLRGLLWAVCFPCRCPLLRRELCRMDAALAFLAVGPAAVPAQQCHCWHLAKPLLGCSALKEGGWGSGALSLHPPAAAPSPVLLFAACCVGRAVPWTRVGSQNCPATVPQTHVGSQNCPATIPQTRVGSQNSALPPSPACLGSHTGSQPLLGLSWSHLPVAGVFLVEQLARNIHLIADPGSRCISSVCERALPRKMVCAGETWDDKALENTSEVCLL